MLACARNGSTLKLDGELTIFEAAEARARLALDLAAGAPLELDLSGLLELDTAGVQVLLWAKREAGRLGFALPFAHHSPAVLEVFERLNLAGTFGDTLVIIPSR